MGFQGILEVYRRKRRSSLVMSLFFEKLDFMTVAVH